MVGMPKSKTNIPMLRNFWENHTGSNKNSVGCQKSIRKISVNKWSPTIWFKTSNMNCFS